MHQGNPLWVFTQFNVGRHSAYRERTWCIERGYQSTPDKGIY
jgi:hypothetical protein